MCSGQIELLKQVNGRIHPTIGGDEFSLFDYDENCLTNRLVIYDININIKKTININGISSDWGLLVGKNIYTNSGKYEFLLFGEVGGQYGGYFCNEDSELLSICTNNIGDHPLRWEP